MADRRNESLDIEEGSVYDRKRRHVKRANLVLLILAVAVAAVAIAFSAYFMATSGLRQSTESVNRGVDRDITEEVEDGSGWGECVDGLYFELNSKGTGYNVVYADQTYSEIVIPDEYEGLPVTGISNGAFSGCTSLKDVTIGRNVANIGDSAFYNCTTLTEIHYNAVCADDLTASYNRTFYNAGQSGKGIAVTIGAEVERIPAYLFYPYYDYSNFPKTTSVEFEEGSVCESIGRLAFAYNTSLENADIPGSVVEIESEAFYGCTSLTDLTIAYGVETVGAHAFSGCTSLAEVTIPDSVESLKNYAFNGDSSLERLTIGAGVTDFGYNVFYECTSLCDVTIKEGVTCIGDMAFSRCISLPEITIPSSVESIGGSAFYDCTALTSIEIPNKVESIGNSAFNGCKTLTSLTIGEGVESIGRSAFYNCTALTSIYYNAANVEDMSSESNVFYNAGATGGEVALTIGKSVENIPEYMFCQSNITSIVFEDGGICESIGAYAFANCASLTSVVIPDSVASIGDHAFEDCTALTEIYYNASEFSATFDSCVFYNAGTGKDTTLTIGASIQSISDYLFYESNITDVIFEDESQCIGIGNYAFCECSALTSIVIPEYIESIGERAFYNCTGMTEIYYKALNLSDLSSDDEVFYKAGTGENTTLTIGSGITRIPSYLFYRSEITSIVFEKGSICESIGGYSFYRCTSLMSVTIPETLTSIENYAFYNCTALTEIRFNAKDMEDLSSYNYVFYNAGQSNSGIIVTIGSKVTKVPAYIFYPYSSSGSTNVSNVIFEEGSICASVDDYAFCGCSSLIDINMPGSVTSIGNHAFSSCASLTSIYIPDGVVSLGDYAFSSCKAMTYVNIPESVTTIGNYTFNNCVSLASIGIPESVTSIGRFAFEDCSALAEIYYNASIVTGTSNDHVFYYAGSGKETTVTIGASIQNIPDYLFEYSKITAVVFEDENVCESIGDYSFYDCSYLTDISIPDSVMSIGSWSFTYCSSLTSITIPENVSSIGDYAFCGCDSVTEIHYNARYLKRSLSYNCNIFTVSSSRSSKRTVTIGPKVPYISSYLFYSNPNGFATNIESVLFEKSSVCQSFEECAFAYCTYLTSFTIPSSLTSIGLSVFNGCTALDSVFYFGSESEWKKISINSNNNSCLIDAQIYYYSEMEPDYEDDCDYWRYVNGEPVVWVREDQ